VIYVKETTTTLVCPDDDAGPFKKYPEKTSISALSQVMYIQEYTVHLDGLAYDAQEQSASIHPSNFQHQCAALQPLVSRRMQTSRATGA
jgi:hypothetical protein